MHPDFDPPSIGSIAGRTSSITAAFFQAITPVVPPTEAEVDEVLAILGMVRGACRCAYCGDARTEWDHLRPIVVDRRPTGYISEIANLVPACGKCNQSKGNSDWKSWMLGTAKLSPKRRGVPELECRVARLEAFASWRKPICIDYTLWLGEARWHEYLERLEVVVAHLNGAQVLAKALRSEVNQKLCGGP